MRESKVICDRCGNVVLQDLTPLRIEAGPQRTTIGETVDLCRDCGERFRDWLRQGRGALEANARA